MKGIHNTASAMAAGVLSAFVFIGVGGRFAMQLLSVITNKPLSFSIEGTIATLVFSTSIGIVGGILFQLVGRHVPGSKAAKGGYFGLLLFIVLIPMLPSPIQEDALALGKSVPLAITLFGLLLMGFGAVLEILYRHLSSTSQIRLRKELAHEPNRAAVHLSNNNQEDSMKISHVAIVCLAAFVFLAHTSSFAQGKAAQNKKLIERGKYLVNLGGCNDCHTPKKMGPHGPELDESKLLSGQPAHEPVPEVPKDVIAPGKWMGLTNMHLGVWAGPWGISFARNLTPDIETGLGSWTEEMFIKTLRTGKHMGEGRPILPPMPWENLAKVDDADLKAIFAYLRSIPAIDNAVPDPISPTGEKIPTPSKK